MELQLLFMFFLHLSPRPWPSSERTENGKSNRGLPHPPGDHSSCDWREISSSLIGWNICGPPASAAVAARGPSPSSSNMNWRALLNFSHLHWCQLLDLLLQGTPEERNGKFTVSWVVLQILVFFNLPATVHFSGRSENCCLCGQWHSVGETGLNVPIPSYSEPKFLP